MIALTKSEFLEIQNAAKCLMKELADSGWHTSNLAGSAMLEVTSERLQAAAITVSATTGMYTDISRISASSGITIKLPNQGYVVSKSKCTELEAIRRMIFGVLVHEFVHIVQKAADRATFDAALLLETQLWSMEDPTDDDRFKLYISQPLEQDARAHQAVAEIYDAHGSGLDPAAFATAFAKTAVHAKTEGMIGLEAGASSQMAEWWVATRGRAWDIYQSL